MIKVRKSSKRNPPRRGPSKKDATSLRITSGRLKNKKVRYNGDPATRPMKERTREAVFSLLGGKFDDEFVVELFAGTGILTFEAISRGASQGVMYELSRPAVTSVVDTAKGLGIADVVRINNADTFRMLKRIELAVAAWPKEQPWIIFCCPPYRLWTEQSEAFRLGLEYFASTMPSGSQIICESDKTFDLETEIPSLQWDVRNYPPAYIGVVRKFDDAD